MTRAMTRDYATQCREYAVHRIRFVATSASRDARNADEFVAGVRAAFGDLDVAPEVVSGQEEARLSFLGATGDLIAAQMEGPYLVVDIGGGSTEFVRGTHTVEAARSVDIGCVRLTERHLRSDPPTPDEIAAAIVDIDRAIDLAIETVSLREVRTLVGLAGSVTTVAAQHLDLRAYDPGAIHLSVATPPQIQAACEQLMGMTRAERAAKGFMHPGRVDVIGAGALVWSRVIASVRASASGASTPVLSTPQPSRTISIRRTSSSIFPVCGSMSAISSRSELVPQSMAPTRTSPAAEVARGAVAGTMRRLSHRSPNTAPPDSAGSLLGGSHARPGVPPGGKQR